MRDHNILTKHKPNFVRTNFIFTKLNANQTFIGNGCNSIIFINSGTAVVEISGVTLTTNQSLSFNGNSGDQDYTNYNVLFVPGVGVRDLNIVQKFNTYE